MKRSISFRSREGRTMNRKTFWFLSCFRRACFRVWTKITDGDSSSRGTLKDNPSLFVSRRSNSADASQYSASTIHGGI
jgi:hypothetical protein